MNAMGQPKSISDGRMNAKRSRLLMLLLGGLLLLSFVLRDGGPPTDDAIGRELSLHMAKATEAGISPEELRDIIETLVRTNRWFNSLPFARVEFKVAVKK